MSQICESTCKDNTFIVHHQIISLGIETYKAENNLPGENLQKIFIKNHNFNTVFKGQNLLVILDHYFGTQFQPN